MKQCPECGQHIADSATQCKYCDAAQPTAEAAQPQSFKCPDCGASLKYTDNRSTVLCSYCHNTIIVPAALQAQAAPSPQAETESLTLSAQVEQLVQAGQQSKAIQLLRDQGFLRLAEAEEVVAHIASGQYGDVRTLILQAQRDSASKE